MRGAPEIGRQKHGINAVTPRRGLEDLDHLGGCLAGPGNTTCIGVGLGAICQSLNRVGIAEARGNGIRRVPLLQNLSQARALVTMPQAHLRNTQDA